MRALSTQLDVTLFSLQKGERCVDLASGVVTATDLGGLLHDFSDTAAAIAQLDLVISVDTGIRAFAAAEEARVLGLDLIVTDHHLPDDDRGIPQALAVINPAQRGCTYPHQDLCGAAVAFKLAHAILLRAAALSDRPEAELERLNSKLLPSFLKLVAIATVADSVPLVGENRTIVALG